MTTFYRRNSRGRYERALVTTPALPDGLHLVYVRHTDNCKSTITSTNIDLDEVWRRAAVNIGYDQLTNLVYRACELYPCQKLTEDELKQWEEFKQTPAGKKLCKGMYRKSAADIARTILDEIVQG